MFMSTVKSIIKKIFKFIFIFPFQIYYFSKTFDCEKFKKDIDDL